MNERERVIIRTCQHSAILKFQTTKCTALHTMRIGVQISNVTLAWKIALSKNVSVKDMVANIYVQDCVEHKRQS